MFLISFLQEEEVSSFLDEFGMAGWAWAASRNNIMQEGNTAPHAVTTSTAPSPWDTGGLWPITPQAAGEKRTTTISPLCSPKWELRQALNLCPNLVLSWWNQESYRENPNHSIGHMRICCDWGLIPLAWGFFFFWTIKSSSHYFTGHPEIGDYHLTGWQQWALWANRKNPKYKLVCLFWKGKELNHPDRIWSPVLHRLSEWLKLEGDSGHHPV